MKRLIPLVLLTIISDTKGAAGDVDLSFDAGSSLNNSASAIVVQPDGKILIGGLFTTVAGAVRRGIARLNPDGTDDARFNPGAGANNLVSSLVLQSDGKMLLGGWFTEINGVSRNRIARLNADGSLDLSFNPGSGADDSIFSIALQADGKILIAGYFTHVNGLRRPYLARLNADGTVDASFNSRANDYTYSIVLQPDGKILVGGRFTALDGRSANGIARLNPDGSLDTSFNVGSGVPYPGVNVIALQPDGRVVIGGGFFTVNGTRHERIARLNSDGSVDAGFNAAANEHVLSIALQGDGKIIVGGQFFHINGVERRSLARLNPDGGLDTSFNLPPVLGVSCVTIEPNGTILVSGGVDPGNGFSLRNLVRLNADGTFNHNLNPGTGINGYGLFSAELQPDGKILIAGNFGDIKDHRRQGIARLESDGRLDESFDPGLILNAAYYSISNPVVYSVALQPDGKVIIGGAFTNINGTSRNCVARLNSDGSLDHSFNPCCGICYSVYRVVLQPDGKVLLPGGYSTGIARLNADGSLDAGFKPDVGYAYDAAVQPDGRILVAGYVITNRAAAYYLSRLNPDGGLDPSFDVGSGPDKGISSVTLQPDGKVLVSGDFTSINGISRNGMARLNSDGSVDLTFNPETGAGSTWSLLRSSLLQPDGKILVSRTFIDVEGKLNGVIGRLNPDGSIDGRFAECTVLGFAGPVAVQSDSKPIIGGSFWTVNGVARAMIARLKGDGITIITQPASRTNAVGTTATFSVTASGPPILRYQWYRNGEPLTDGARISGTMTDMLTFNHVQFRDAGTYTVVLSNDDESVSSDPATLSVVVPRAIRTK